MAPLFLSLLNRKDGLQHILSCSLVASSLLNNEMCHKGVTDLLLHALCLFSIANAVQLVNTCASYSFCLINIVA